jgi:hypothetical protein
MPWQLPAEASRSLGESAHNQYFFYLLVIVMFLEKSFRSILDISLKVQLMLPLFLTGILFFIEQNIVRVKYRWFFSYEL